MNLVYPNQKIVTIHKAPVDAQNIYLRIKKEAMQSASQNLSGEEFKAFMYLASNQDNYEMALSTEDMAAKMGGSIRGMQSAVRKLIVKGYLVQQHKNRYDFYESPNEHQEKQDLTQKKESKPPENGKLKNQKTSFYKEEKNVEIINNNKKNTKDNNNKDLLVENSEEWKMITQRIRVNLSARSIAALSQAAGTEVSPRVINWIISHNTRAFENNMDKAEGYRFKTLLNLVETNYEKMARAIAAEDMERKLDMERRRTEPRIDYDHIYRADPEPEGYFDDISALLDEMF